jgi:hypothetical protein
LTVRHETPEPTDWTTLFRAFAEALEWALDRAADLARAYPQEVAIVERVRAFARKRIAGEPAHLRIEDLLFAIGLIAGALERQLGLSSRPPATLGGYLRGRKPFIRKDDPVRIDVRRLRAVE